MAAKKSKTTKKTKKTSTKSTKKGSKAKGKKAKKDVDSDDVGIVVIEEDIEIDKNAELEARRAYLEEARSQEASSD